MVEKVVEFEDDAGRWRDVQTQRGARTVQIKILERAVQTNHLEAYDGSYLSALV